jgi:tryptophan synthase beta chain
MAIKTDKCRYVLGSVLDHVLLHQSIIGLESKAAMDKYGINPDIIIGCAGGGSNLGGLMAPFMGEKIAGKSKARFIAVEPASCPSLTRGRFVYDFGDTAKTTPLLRMQTLGNGFIPSANHAGGLRYHGMSPILSKLYRDGYLEARSEIQTDVFDAAIRFMKTEGILPAPESSHAIKAAIDEALECKKTGEKKVILFGLSGTGYFDLSAYMSYNAKTLSDQVPTDEELERGFASIPDIPQNK